MGRRRKPGTPGRTTIPPEVVKSVKKRLRATFRESPDADMLDLEVTAQQHYLYLETRQRPGELWPGLVAVGAARKRRRPPNPLGRMVWTGNVEKWELELYKWSDECWDEENEAWSNGGTPEECLAEAVLGWGKFA